MTPRATKGRVRKRNQPVLRVGQIGIEDCRQRVLFIAPIDEIEDRWAAGALIERVAHAVEARLPWRHGILNPVLSRHAAPDLVAFNDFRQRRDRGAFDLKKPRGLRPRLLP